MVETCNGVGPNSVNFTSEPHLWAISAFTREAAGDSAVRASSNESYH
jgi:hypothetical protein